MTNSPARLVSTTGDCWPIDPFKKSRIPGAKTFLDTAMSGDPGDSDTLASRLNQPRRIPPSDGGAGGAVIALGVEIAWRGTLLSSVDRVRRLSLWPPMPSDTNT